MDYSRKTDSFDWARFRSYAKLDRKLDDTLTEYFKAFYAMCKKVVGRHLTEDEENLPISVDPITEEKVNRCLARIDLLSKVREEIIFHPELDDRLKLCQPQLDLPEWWVCGKHDKDLLFGVAKYGFFRLDYNLMNDPELSFIDVVRNFENPPMAEIPERRIPSENIESEVKLLLHTLIGKVESLSQSLSESETELAKEKESELTEQNIDDDIKKEVAEDVSNDAKSDPTAKESSDEKEIR